MKVKNNFLWHIKYSAQWNKSTIYDPVYFDGYIVFDTSEIEDVIEVIKKNNEDSEVKFFKIEFIELVKEYESKK